MNAPPWTIDVGDALEVLRAMPDASAHCCVTSPPYWALRDYGTGAWEGGDPLCTHTYSKGGHAASTLGRYDNGLTDKAIEEKVSVRGHATYLQECRRCGARRVDRQLGLEASPQEYVDRLVVVFREVRRVLRDDGTLWLNLGDTYVGNAPGNARPDHSGSEFRKERGKQAYGIAGAVPRTRRAEGLKQKDLVGIPWRVAFALQADGWYLRADIIWHKPNPLPESVRNRPSKAHEYVFLLSKSERYYYDGDAVRRPLAAKTKTTYGARRRSKGGDGLVASANLARDMPERRPRVDAAGVPVGASLRTVWRVATSPFRGAHFATFPPKLIEPCVLAGCPVGGTVLDPFVGAGTSMLVAVNLGRRGRGIELNEKYAAMADARVAAATRQVPLINVGRAS